MKAIPIDTARLRFTCVKTPKPRLVNQETGELKVDKQGNTVFETTFTVEDANDRIELIKIATSGDPRIRPGQETHPQDLIGYVWEITQNGQPRWGISFRATALLPAPGGDHA